MRGLNAIQMVIILITTVLISVAFAVAILRAGGNAAERSEQLIRQALSESTATLILRGTVVGASNQKRTALKDIAFTLASGGQSHEAADISPAGTIISYIDRDQALNIPGTEWSTSWLIGNGPLLDAGEAVELRVSLAGLSPALGTRRDFTIRVHALGGAVLLINRKTPAELSPVVDLTQ